MPGVFKNADALMGEALIELTRRSDFGTRIKMNKYMGVILLKCMNPILKDMIKRFDYKKLEGNITTEMGLMVGDLADIIRK